MPRIRSWQDLHLFRPGAGHAYAHIDALFSGPIDWDLIAGHLPDMLRVALSIKAGRLLPSAILRRLGTYSRKNRLYFAFRELGRAIRTRFLLRYIRSLDLRRTIGAATNKSEHFNRYAQWAGLSGAGLVAALDLLARVQKHTAHIGGGSFHGTSKTTPEQLDLFDALSLPKPA